MEHSTPWGLQVIEKMERETGLEPAASSLGIFKSIDLKNMATTGMHTDPSKIAIPKTMHRRDTRLTFHPTQVEAPVWFPDGRQVAFSFTQGGAYDLYRQDLGGGSELPLFRSNQNKSPTDWSSDGRFLLFYPHRPQPKIGCMGALSTTGDHKACPVLEVSFSESQARFSPHTHWIAYTSNKSGRNEVYVRLFLLRFALVLHLGKLLLGISHHAVDALYVDPEGP